MSLCAGELADYQGKTWHVRHLPKLHRFTYRYQYLGFWAEQLPKLKPSRWISTTQRALQELRRSDYLQGEDPSLPLEQAVLKKLQAQLETCAQGRVLALVKPRGLFSYFSPVNFYLVFDQALACTHLLAEVSNTPWNERHYYALDLSDPLEHAKEFVVSPFNPLDQRYHWQVDADPERVRIQITIHDDRGRIFDAGVDLHKRPIDGLRRFAVTHAASHIRTLSLIYWHAFVLYFFKRLPFIGKKGALSIGKETHD